MQDYSRTERVQHTEIMLPAGAPERFQDRATLWNEVEKSEKRVNSQLAREVVVALPHELSENENRELVREFTRGFVARGMCADVAIHSPSPHGHENNVHAHIVLTTREVNEKGFTTKQRAWNDRALTTEWRESWERLANQALERAGRRERIDCRSLEAQKESARDDLDAERFRAVALGPRNLPVTGPGYHMHRSGRESAQWKRAEKRHGQPRQALSGLDAEIAQTIEIDAVSEQQRRQERAGQAKEPEQERADQAAQRERLEREADQAQEIERERPRPGPEQIPPPGQIKPTRPKSRRRRHRPDRERSGGGLEL